MASSGGHWVKLAQANTGTMVFVPKGKTIEQVLVGKKPAGTSWPNSLDEVTKVKGLGGSTGAQLVQDANGNLYVMKKGANVEHIWSESAADKLYEGMGVAVPSHQMYGDTKLARYIEGQTLAQAQANDPAVYNKAVAELQKGFAADVLLGNWDVVGLNKDNILIDKAGKVWRIDNGGALEFRAMGAKKGSAWNDTPSEIFTMRTKGTAGSIFGSMSLSQIAQSINSLKPGHLPTTQLQKRWGKLKQVAELIETGIPDSALQGYLGW